MLGSSVAATATGLGAVAGLVMGFSGGLLAGGGAGWLLAVGAESVSTELSKDRLGLHFAAWITWCLAAVTGGLAGWLVGWLGDRAERRSVTAGLVLRVAGYLLLLGSTAVVLVRTGTAAALWSSLAGPATAVGRSSNAFALGLAAGLIGALATIDSTAASTVAVAAVLIFIIWILPWTLALAAWSTARRHHRRAR